MTTTTLPTNTTAAAGVAVLRRLRRVRWAVRVTLGFGVAASVAANILHARHNPISQTIAAWPPLALLLTVELISRVPVHRRALAAVRLLATAAISGIAAWVSYWHMAGVADRYGETGTTPYLLPISVDGLIVVASISLVELAGRIRDAETPPPPRTVVERTSPSTTDARPPAAVGDVVELFTDGDEADQLGVSDQLIARAREEVAAYRRATGRDITRDQLRAQLRTSNATAGELLRLIRDEDQAAGNGRPVDGHTPGIGVLTR
jgi:hypothetical protein